MWLIVEICFGIIDKLDAQSYTTSKYNSIEKNNTYHDTTKYQVYGFDKSEIISNCTHGALNFFLLCLFVYWNGTVSYHTAIYKVRTLLYFSFL